MPTWFLDNNATYVITGGLGGVGRSIARWMMRRGAKHLLLLSRSGARSEAALALLEELESNGVEAAAPPCDISDETALSSILSYCSQRMPRVKGCIQGSMVLKASSCILFATSSLKF